MRFLLVLSLAGAPVLPEEGSGSSLRWSAPPECPDERAVRDEIERVLGRPLPGDVQLQAEVTVQRRADGLFSLDLELRGERHTGRRHLEGEQCQALADAAAIIVAVAIDPRVLEREIQPEPMGPEPTPTEPASKDAPHEVHVVPPPSTETPTASEPASPQPVRPEPTAPRPEAAIPPGAVDRPPAVHVGIAVFAGPGFALLPDPTAVVALGTSVSGTLWRAEVGIAYWIPRDESSPNNEAVGGRFQLWSVQARGCVEPGVSEVTFPICAGLDAGAMHGTGRGALRPTSSSAPWVAVVGGLGLLYRPRFVRGRLGVLLRGEGAVALTRPSFRTEPSGLVFRAPAGGAQVLGGVEIRLR